MKKESKRENVYILIIILLIILNISGYLLFQQQIKVMQKQIIFIEKQVKEPTLSEIVIPEASLNFRNKNGKKIAEITTGTDGSGLLNLYDREGRKTTVSK